MLKVLVEELRRAERAAYEKLIRMKPHENNNAAGAVQALLHSCLTYTPQVQPGNQADYGNALQVAITHISHLNTFMRGFAEVIELLPPHLQPSALRPLLEGSARLLQAKSRQRNIHWPWNFAPNPPSRARQAADGADFHQHLQA